MSLCHAIRRKTYHLLWTNVRSVINVPTDSTVETVPSCLTSAAKNYFFCIMQGICKLSTRGQHQSRNHAFDSRVWFIIYCETCVSEQSKYHTPGILSIIGGEHIWRAKPLSYFLLYPAKAWTRGVIYPKQRI